VTANEGRNGTAPLPAVRPRASVRQANVRAGPVAALVALVAMSAVVHGFRLLSPAYPGGDLLYHGALALGLHRDGLPLEGAYAGLPAYYPPGFHVLLGGLTAVLGQPPVAAAAVLFVLLIPVLPLGTYLLVRRLTGRPWVAVLAVALTLFGGAYDLNSIRQWVNSLFVSGQAAYTAYPRDLVFAILPFAVLAFVRALEPIEAGPRRWPAWAAWAAVAGLLLGAAALIQVQLLLPIPVALAAAALAVAGRHPQRRGRALAALCVTGGLALLLVAPWLIETAETIRRNGGVALDSSDQLEPARFGFWGYPRQFGLLLPLGLVGTGVALLFLRRPDGPRPLGAPGPWRPSLPEGGVLLATWWALPFLLGILYDPSWPLEDALRPQRLWLIASQPLAILAAIGLVTAAEHVLLARHPRWVTPAVVALVLVASLPATAATASIVASTWTRDVYAMLDRDADRVPHFDALLGRDGPRSTVLAPEDWSALAWFETGLPVVSLVPPGYAKLAFDPARFTAASQDERRAAMVTAWAGNADALAAVAARFEASRIVIPRDDDRWALMSLPAAAVVAADPAAAPKAAIAEGNGWDAVDLAPGDRLLLPEGPSGSLKLAIRVGQAGGAIPEATRVTVVALPATGDGTGRRLGEIAIPPTDDDWRRGSLDVELEPGERIALEAVGPTRLQAVNGWSARTDPPTGWRVAAETAEAVVLEPAP
jgi:hypothetical protein